MSSNYLYTTREFNHEGKKLDIFQERIIYRDTAFRDFNVSIYLEYGLLDKLTLVANVPFKILTSKRTELIGGGTVARIATLYTLGFADLSMAGKYGVLNGPFALSLEAGLKLPLWYEPQPGDDGAPLGTGDIDIETNVQLGRSLYPLPAYLTGRIGYRWRSGSLHDQIAFTAEAGYSAGPVLFKLSLDGLKSTITPPDLVGQPVTTPLPGGGGALPNIIEGDQDIFKINPSIIVSVTQRFAMQGEILHIFAGKNTVAGNTFSLSLIYSN